MAHPNDPTTAFWALGSDSFTLTSGTWSYSQPAAQIGLANFVHSLRPADADDLDTDLLHLATEPEHPCRRLVIDHDTPSWVEADLVMRGWTAEAELRLVLPERAQPTPSARHSSRVRTTARRIGPADELDPDWSARRAMFRTDHLEEDSRGHRAPRPQSDTDAAITLRHAIEQHATYHGVVIGQQLAGFLCTWASPDGNGVIEDVFVHPDHRDTGIATALLLHAVQMLREAGAGPVMIAADPTDTPRHLYHRLGFRPHAVVRSMVR